MPIGINNSAIYAKCAIYRLFAKGLTEQVYTILGFFKPVLKQFTCTI